MNEAEKIIEKYNIPIVQIDPDRNYWLIRTQSGEYHEEFYFDDFIAIGWNEFNSQKDFRNPLNERFLKNQIAKTYPESKQPGLIYNQIKRFFTELSIGDVVMIPSKNSSHISFGRIISKPYNQVVSETDIEAGNCPFEKRMNVKWIKTVKRSDLDPYLYKMMHSHHTINNANDYANFIDRTLHTFYIKGNSAHLVININKHGDLGGLDYFDFGHNIINLANEVSLLDFTDDSFDKRKDLQVKSNVQSPGVVEFISTTPQVILGIGVVLTFFVGGKVNMQFTKEETNLNAESKGLIELFMKYKKQKDKTELEKLKLLHKQSMERVQAELPTELKKLPDVPDQEE